MFLALRSCPSVRLQLQTALSLTLSFCKCVDYDHIVWTENQRHGATSNVQALRAWSELVLHRCQFCCSMNRVMTLISSHIHCVSKKVTRVACYNFYLHAARAGQAQILPIYSQSLFIHKFSHFYSAVCRKAKFCDERVCLFVCPRTHIYVRSLISNFLCLLYLWPWLGMAALRCVVYVLPVLWITPCLARSWRRKKANTQSDSPSGSTSLMQWPHHAAAPDQGRSLLSTLGCLV